MGPAPCNQPTCAFPSVGTKQQEESGSAWGLDVSRSAPGETLSLLADSVVWFWALFLDVKLHPVSPDPKPFSELLTNLY